MNIQNNMTTLLNNVGSAVCKVFRFYVDGFKSMTVGRVLWTVILIKLFVIFVILKLFFFPDVLSQKSGGNKASYVAGELTTR